MTAGQSLKVHIDGDGPGCPSPCPAAPGPALCSHSLCLALPCSSQQVFLEDTPTQGCSLNSYKSFQHNKYLCLPGPGEMVVNKQRKGLCPHSTHRLKQWILEHLAMSGDIFDCHNLGRRHLEQWTPTFLAPGTSFMEDSFSMSSIIAQVLQGHIQAKPTSKISLMSNRTRDPRFTQANIANVMMGPKHSSGHCWFPA